MLFYSPKKPAKLRLVHLNQIQQKQQQRFDHVFKQSVNKPCCLQKFTKLKSKKSSQKHQDSGKKVFVLDFLGNIKADAVANLREEISAIISAGKQGDEVVVRLESGGGQVNAYGLAAAQLVRLKDSGFDLTICVDKIAASGGYMMACTANKILASEFAVIGSVGVVSQLPNFHEFLKQHNIGFEMFTAGEYKRTVTMFGENSDKDRAKYQEDINRIHQLFKDFIQKHRQNIDIDKIATGEFWFGVDAKTLNLVDDIMTSDAYLLQQMNKHDVFLLQSYTEPTLAEKLGLTEHLAVSGTKALQKASQMATRFLANLSDSKTQNFL
ncbi:MAG: protease SohB [Moraxella sp.]|nr:MAG: protease SohB [Moraxella sp.]